MCACYYLNYKKQWVSGLGMMQRPPRQIKKKEAWANNEKPALR